MGSMYELLFFKVISRQFDIIGAIPFHVGSMYVFGGRGKKSSKLTKLFYPRSAFLFFILIFSRFDVISVISRHMGSIYVVGGRSPPRLIKLFYFHLGLLLFYNRREDNSSKLIKLVYSRPELLFFTILSR